MRMIAFYLPQYHRIRENDEWWGLGYTEWTAVRAARPLYNGHDQPRQPLDDNYYDLSDLRVAVWQQKLAKTYGVHGFCYYHYWFLGRQLLQSPLEQLLAAKELTLPFCMAWANQPWTRTWYGQATTTLMPQEYGSTSDWKIHFQYLLPFLKDSRYIKFNNKPLFIIHDSAHIKHCKDMLDYWQTLAFAAGLGGISFVKTLGGFRPDKRSLPFEAQLYFEPGFTMINDISTAEQIRRNWFGRCKAYLRRFGLVKESVNGFWDYETVNAKITKRKPDGDLPTFLGAFTDWDNSPRRKHRASVFRGSTPLKFEFYLKEQIARAQREFGTDLIFVNAWNEWGEGAYLEPDKRYGTAYLQAVKNALTCDKRPPDDAPDASHLPRKVL